MTLDLVEGKILYIMESWPLQLMIETKAKEKVYVTLLSDTPVIRNNNKINYKELAPNLQVKIKGSYYENELAMTANTIEVTI